LEVTRLILKYFGKGDEMIKFVEDRKGHDRRYAIDATKIKALGWEPLYPREKFEEALKDEIEWYLKNTEWVDAVWQRKAEWDEKALRV
jgi:dTDP-glucose 4,6-dehydratase